MNVLISNFITTIIEVMQLTSANPREYFSFVRQMSRNAISKSSISSEFEKVTRCMLFNCETDKATITLMSLDYFCFVF